MSAGKAYNWTIYLENDNLGGVTMLDRTSINLYPNRPGGVSSLGLARVWLYLIIHGSTMWALDDPHNVRA